MRSLILLLLALSTWIPAVDCRNASTLPPVVNIGALLTVNSTIGRVAKVAVSAAVDDINFDQTVLKGLKLVVSIGDSDCNGFLGIAEAMQFMEKDIVAVLGPQCSTIAHIIAYVSNELQVPLLSSATDPTLSSLQFPFFARITHSDFFQMCAIAAVVDYYQWKLVIALYSDDDYGRNGVAALDDKLAERRCKISYKARFAPGASRNEIQDLLVKIALMESRIIIVHSGGATGLMIFSVAKSLQMMESGYVWIATDWLSSFLDSNSPLSSENTMTLQGVLTLRQHAADSKLKSSLFTKWSSLAKRYGSSGNFQLNSYGLYIYDSVWMVAHALEAFLHDGGRISFSNDTRLSDMTGSRGMLHLEAMSIFNDGKLLIDSIRKSNFRGVSGQVKFDSNGDLIHPAYDIMNVVGTGLRLIGYWSNYSGLSVVPPERVSLSHKQQLHDVIWPGETTEKPRGWVFPNNGKVLKVGVPYRFSFPEFVTKDPLTESMKGYSVDVFTQALALLPYPVPYKLVPFGDGSRNPNYTDLVYKVSSNFFDAAIGDIAITRNRTGLVDFTQPFIESGLVVLAPVKKESSNAWAFLQPFTLQLWVVSGLLFLIVGAVVWILEHRINDEFRGSPRRQIITIFWFSFSTLFFSHRENTVSTLGRTVVIIWLFVVLIIQSSYTASLTSILTVHRLLSPISGIDSLRATDWPIGYQVGSFAENYMVEELNIPRSRLKALGSPEEYAQALELGPDKGGVAAIVDERPYIELFLATQCHFSIIGSDFTRSGWGFAFPRDSPLAVDMSTAILALSENGDLQRINDKWLTRTVCSSDGNEIDANRLDLSSFWGLFLLCGVACFLALVIYFFHVFREFLRYARQDESDDLSNGRRISGSLDRIRSFFSFVDERKDGSTRRGNKNPAVVASNDSISN